MSAAVDRIAPTRRPEGKAIGYQRWTELLFLHREIPVDAVAATLPAGLEPDLFEGRAYVGIVPFRMSGVRPAWAPASLAFRFLETNVRTYVLCDGEPGVYFYSLEANSPFAVFVARRFWGLPYFNATMSSVVEDGVTRYESVRAGWGKTSVRRRNAAVRSAASPPAEKPDSARLNAVFRAAETPRPTEEGSLDRFLIERYYLFVRRRESIWRGQVHHVPYPLTEVALESAKETLAEAAGFPREERPPEIVHYSPGVDVEIFPLQRVAGSS